jgi:hypothetical protein
LGKYPGKLRFPGTQCSRQNLTVKLCFSKCVQIPPFLGDHQQHFYDEARPDACKEIPRASSITACRENSRTTSNAQTIDAHELPRTTELYDRTSDEITLDERESIAI